MKMYALLIALLFFVGSASAQEFSSIANITEFKSGDECRKYDSSALNCANYIVSHPNDENDLNRMIAIRFLIIWMTSTPDYSFAIDAKAGKLGGKKDFVLGLYMAYMAKYCMEHKDKASDEKDVTFNAYHMVAQYCDNASNNIKPDKDLKKLIDADKNGTLADYLGQK